MEIHNGDLIVKEDTACDYTEVTGSVYVSGPAKLNALQTVGGNVSVSGSAKLDALQTVGGSVYVYGSAKLNALETVGGSVYVSGSAKLNAPNIKIKNDTTVSVRCRSILMAAFAAAGFSFADGILAKIVSTKGNTSKVIVCGKIKESYLVTDGESFSHGDTLKSARDGLKYKIGSRDMSEFKKWKKNKVISMPDAIRAYRVITGACESGTKQWVCTHEVPKSLTVKKAIELTRGAYGHEKFSEFFEK